MTDDLKKLIDDMSPEEKLLVLSYFSSDREEFLFAAGEAKARFERADGYRSDKADDLRQSYTDAARAAYTAWAANPETSRDLTLGERISDAVMAVRDDEVAALRERAEKAEAVIATPDAAVYNLVWTAARNEVTRSWLASQGLVVMTGDAHAGELADLRRLRGEADLRAEKAEASLAETTAKLDRLTTRGQIAGEEIELANRRLDLFQREMNEQREIIADQRRVNGEAIHRAEQAEDAIARVREVHDVHSCDRDGHIHRSTPNPCVNDGFCSCGQRDPCPTLTALDTPKDVTS